MIRKINWRYAIGELLIVITGITIAFALNNWAQNQRDRNLAKQYIEGLQNDLEEDILTLDSNIHKLQGTIKAIDQFIPHLFQKLPGRDSVPGLLFRKIHDYVYFFPHDATYQSMLNSGDLNLIRNFGLKNRIVEHYGSYAELYKTLERHEHFAQSYTADYFMHKTNHLLLFQNQQPEILDDPFLKNLLFSSKGIFMMQSHAHTLAKDRCQALIEELVKYGGK